MTRHAAISRMIDIEEGRDYILTDQDILPYRLVKNLGHGHSANVEMIEDQRTGAVYARKMFRITGPRAERLRIFRNEIQVIRRLAQHHHIIRVFATYIHKRETGLILSPVASQGDLEAFLEDYREGTRTSIGRKTLESAFGCLASGLLFMHSQSIRHKDIKPRNILIHQNTVLYTDFGYSLDHSDATGSTTTGRPDSFTLKFCAPEIQGSEPRNTKSDIYSLGCVFFEMYASLGFCALPESVVPYYDRVAEVKNLLQESFRTFDERFAAVGDMICQMIDNLPNKRPTAKEVTVDLWRRYQTNFCEQCRHSLPRENAHDFPGWPLSDEVSHDSASVASGNLGRHNVKAKEYDSISIDPSEPHTICETHPTLSPSRLSSVSSQSTSKSIRTSNRVFSLSRNQSTHSGGKSISSEPRSKDFSGTSSNPGSYLEPRARECSPPPLTDEEFEVPLTRASTLQSRSSYSSVVLSGREIYALTSPSKRIAACLSTREYWATANHAHSLDASSIPDPTTAWPMEDRPLSAWEIARIKSNTERVAAYENAREYWAKTDHGLPCWLTTVGSRAADGINM